MILNAESVQLGQLLQTYRRRAGLTQNELAGFSTVSVRTIRDLELGRAKRPRRETVRLLSDGLRLIGERRATLQLAAGYGMVDELLDAAHRSRPLLGEASAPPLHGRTGELRALTALLASDAGRLATITGMGGVGKTRLALAVAQGLHGERGTPVLWVPMAGAGGLMDERDAVTPSTGLLADWVRRLLGESTRAVDELVPLFGERPFLLVVDDNGPLPVSDAALNWLLEHCPRLKIIRTARTRPRLTGRSFPLSPLPLPLPGGEPGPAAELLLWHIRQVQPEFDPVERNLAAVREISRALDGIPRALEAAASWFTIASPRQLADLARSQPGLLTDPPSMRTDAHWATDAVREARDVLTDHQVRLLDRVVGWQAPWSLELAADRTGSTPAETAEAVHALLLNGLIRPVDSADPDAVLLTVLNLVRDQLSGPPA